VTLALEHREPDRVPLDLGGSSVTGMHVSRVYALRQALNLDPPGTPVKVMEPFQMLGEIGPDLRKVLRVDVVRLAAPTTNFGFRFENWKPWRLFDGTPVLVPGGFNTRPNERGDILMYPEGDSTVPPSAMMPKGGFYFDAIAREQPLKDSNMNPQDNLEEYGMVSEDDLKHYRYETERLFNETDNAILAHFGGSSFGDIALIRGMRLKYPRGIRDPKEWYASHITRPDYVYRVFQKQSELAIANLARIHEVVGDRIAAVFVTGTDFGMQRGSIMSNSMYRKFYLPFHKAVNDWIHEHAPWKTFIHSCGSIEPLIREFIEARFDIINPIQTSAVNMDLRKLKEKYGHKLTFWGGGVDTQSTLPFGTPEQIRKEVRERIRVLGTGGGFVFSAIHNIQPEVPVQNILAIYEALHEHDNYPIG